MTETKRPLKVFLCHASSDKTKTRKLYHYLKKRGIQPWFDEVDLLPGLDWETEIQKEMAASDVIIICLSKKSVEEEGFIQKEIKFALDKADEMPAGRITFIPIKFEECEIPFALRRYHWVDLADENGYLKMMKALTLRASQLGRTIVELPKTTVEEDNWKENNNISEERVLEAAIEKQIIVGKPASLFVWIRRRESKNIISVVSSTDEYVHLDEDNIKTKDLEIDFSVLDGQVLSAGMTLKLVAHEYTPPLQQKKIYVPPMGDSEVCTFIVTPKKTGEPLLSLEVLKDEVSLVNKNIRTTAVDTEKNLDNRLTSMTIPMIVKPSRTWIRFVAISVMIVALTVIGLRGTSLFPGLTPTFTPTPSFTPTPTSTRAPIFTSTPYICPFQSQTDNETIIKLIKAEASASNFKDLSIILKIFSPNAVFYDYAPNPPGQWIGPRNRYEKVLFPTTEFRGVEHFDILPAGSGIDGNTAYYTSGSKGSYRIGNGDWKELRNGSSKTTQYGSEHWILKKNSNGCWVITQMEFNAGQIKFP